MSAAFEQLQQSIERRLAAALTTRKSKRSTTGERAIVERAIESLGKTKNLADVRAWATKLAKALDKPATRDKPAVCMLLDYLRPLAQRKSSALNVRLNVDDLQDPYALGWNLPDRALVDLRSLLPKAESKILDIGHEFVESWYPCSPRLDRERFDIVFESKLWAEVPLADLKPFEERAEWTGTINWETGETQALGQRRHVELYAQAHGIVQELAGSEQGLCAMSLPIDQSAALVSLDVVRASWDLLLDVGVMQDVLIWPLWPVQAAWAISHFNAGHLEIGRLRGKWPHNLEIDD